MSGFSFLTSTGPPKETPFWRLYVRIFILVLACIVLGLSAWAISLFDDDGGSSSGSSAGDIFGGFRKRAFGIDKPPGKEPPSLMIYVCVQTLLVVGGALAIEKFAPQLFMRIGVFAGYVLTCIMALVGWAYMASSAKDWSDITDLVNAFVDDDNPVTHLHQAESASAGLGALMWILVILETVLFVLACKKDPNEQGLPTTQLNVMAPKQETSQYAQQPSAPQQPVYPQQSYQQPQQSYQQPQQGYQ